MKKAHLIFAIIFCAFISRAQQYHPMFGYHHMWYVDNSASSLTPRSQNDNLAYSVMDANGDTLIGSKQYFKATLYRDNDSISFDTTLFFREDTTLQKVWLLTNDSGNEKLIYNYSLNKGDSIFLDFDFQDSSSLYYTKTGWYFIDSDKIIPTEGGLRKALFLSNPKNLYNPFLFRSYPELEWIEQTGSTIMPDYTQHDIDNVDAHRWGYWWNFYYIMLCSFNDSNKIYHNPAFNYANYTYTDSDSCQLSHSSGIMEINKPDMYLKLFPNPCNDELQLNASQLQSSFAEVEIFNVTGIEVFDSRFKFSSPNFQTTINVSKIPSGIYFVRLLAPNDFAISKFVKY